MLKHKTPRIFAALRICDSQICFLDHTGAFAELSDGTVLYDSRDECYTDARKASGLVAQIGYQLADAYGLRNAIWELQRAADDARTAPEIVRDAA